MMVRTPVPEGGPMPARLDPRLLTAAGVAEGALEVVDFLVPLWAGATLGLSAAATGVLLATQTLAALLARPVAGRLTDRGSRAGIAVAAATLLGGGMVGYALAGSLPSAAVAAVAVGTGAACFEVPVLAYVADRDASPRGYGRLLSFESRGALLAFTGVFLVLDRVGYRSLFLAAAVAFALAAALVAAARLPAGRPSRMAAGERHRVTRELGPVLGLVLVTTAARAASLLLVLLHLQRHFALGPQDIGLVMAPGFLVFVTASGTGHRLGERIGRRAALTVALLLTGGATVALGSAHSVLGVGAGWVVAAVGFATAIPVERSLVAAATGGGGTGHGFGLHGAAALAGSVIGSAAAGTLYGGVGWWAACQVAGVAMVAALPLVRPAVRDPIGHY
jgi:DHA1 family multidrug resistance protein-like MFS transporter